ncbi:Retrovirus-related Pol polyprotein from transposon [Tetrabaena socialis]|uniref:Retrovirus-related Pol polyprotein from transposon n=1 Tax=Tetrabaena socialis TaxID=47790 RepID=A0A2J7ZQH6_9CHLO|nr:Retrovirus-related Pol polyprotein from transposon [Tetrabaena socialis]|eukprot:PNH02523.1 Retrovirus-related Pol polyprotein from transposon [Tetrabaena socialis]
MRQPKNRQSSQRTGSSSWLKGLTLLLLCLAVHALPYNDLGQRAPPAPPAHNRQLEHLHRLEDLGILPRTPQPAALDTLAYSSNAQPEPAARVPILADAQPKPVARPTNLANAQSKPAAQAPNLSDAQPKPDAVLLSNASARPKPVASMPKPDPAPATSAAVRLTPATRLPGEAERVTLATGLNSSPDCTSPEGQRAPPAATHFAKDPSYGYTWCERPDLELELRSRFRELLRDNEGLFARSLKELGCYSGELGPATIDLMHDNPIYESARRHSDLERGIMEAKCIELRDAGIIKPSTSAHYALNHTMPAKKDAEGNWTDSRFCCDARPLNAATRPDMYRPPLPEELFDKVGTATWLSKCDCRAAFNQIPMRAEDQEKTSFHWNGSLWQYTRNLYGLRNATACFQRVMDHHIRKAGLQDCCVVFVDDLLVFSHTAEQHYADLSRVLDMLRDINIKLHPDKTVLVASEVEFLGHLVSARGLRPMEAKVAAIQAIRAPSSLTELLSLLGLMNYYRGYLPRYSDLTAPLTLLTKKSVVWNRSTWLPEHQAALDVLKLEFSREGLCLRRLDPSRPIILHTDFSAVGVSGVLGQQDDNGSEYMCACVSRSLNVRERNYISYKGEMLAAGWAMKTLRPYLHGRQFTLVTDHAPLLWLMENRDLTGQYARWALIMQEYNFDVAHRPGALHFNADVLSRSPVPSAWDGTGARLDEDTDPTPPGPRLVAYPGLATHVTHVGDPRALATLLSARRFDLLAATLVTTRGGALPSDAELLAGGNGFATDAVDAPHDNDNTASADAAAQRRCHALGAVRDLSRALRGLHTAPPRRQTYVAQDANAPVTTISLNTSLVSQHFYDKASSEGLVVLELLGGHASGLEACLRAGWSVRTYIASGMDSTLAPVIQARVNHLRAMYPQQLLARATAHPVSTLDVRGMAANGLSLAVPTPALKQLLCATSWAACNAYSPIFSLRTSSIRPWAMTPVSAATFNMTKRARDPYIMRPLTRGPTSVLPRTFTVFCPITARPLADAIPLRQLPVAGPPPPPPYFTSTIPGQPIGAFPPGPLAHYVLPLRAGGTPALDCNEVEAVLGLCLNSSFSKAPEDARRAALSLGIAVEPAAVIFTYAHALQRAFITPHHMATLHPVAVPDPGLTLGGGYSHRLSRCRKRREPSSLPALCPALSLLHDASPYGCTMHIALVTEIMDGGTGGPDDVWLDVNTLSYIRSMCAPDGLPRLEVRRITRRAAGYSQGVGGAGISRIMANGSLRAVPPPAERRQLIESAHARNGHFGSRRTCAILQLAFWWHGMARDVAAVVSECKVCDRANTSGNVRPEALNPLPVLGPFYRWGVDLAGPLPPTARGHRYVMIAIEHFSKHIELVPLLDKTAACVAQAFLQHVLARFSAPAEVLTDQGTEFQGEFGDLLRECFIDHRTTSAGHPQSDGAAERVVQLVKRGLRKYCHERQAPNCWDQDLPWLALGYRCSPQASTLLSPYRLLYGVDPVVPPGVRARWAHPLDLAMPDRDALWALLEQRGQDMRADMLSAGGNLAIAQHRDKQRYAQLRSGSYAPRVARFEPGDYVYVLQRNRLNTLQLPTLEQVLRVVSITAEGVATLVGRCGGQRKEHVSNLAICHLPNLDPQVDPHVAIPDADLACERCGFPDQEDKMLLCDGCGAGWHLYCLQPPLTSVPKGTWVCPTCLEAGVTVTEVAARALRERTPAGGAKFRPACKSPACLNATPPLLLLLPLCRITATTADASPAAAQGSYRRPLALSADQLALRPARHPVLAAAPLDLRGQKRGRRARERLEQPPDRVHGELPGRACTASALADATKAGRAATRSAATTTTTAAATAAATTAATAAVQLASAAQLSTW